MSGQEILFPVACADLPAGLNDSLCQALAPLVSWQSPSTEGLCQQ